VTLVFVKQPTSAELAEVTSRMTLIVIEQPNKQRTKISGSSRIYFKDGLEITTTTAFWSVARLGDAGQ
jgi:hypothetical protein